LCATIERWWCCGQCALEAQNHASADKIRAGELLTEMPRHRQEDGRQTTNEYLATLQEIETHGS
jgi:hypothetical protein